jgi:hypothetical protein
VPKPKLKQPKSPKSNREPTLRDEIAASGETPSSRKEDLGEDHAFLAREFLTWLVYHADAEGGGFTGSGDVRDFSIQFGGRLALHTELGMVNDLTVKGSSPAISPDLRYLLAGGLAVKEAELHLTFSAPPKSSDEDERIYSFGLAAESFDLKRVKLPALLTEEEDDRADERLTLLAELDAALQIAFAQFLEQRTAASWARSVVPALRKWLDDGI